MNFFFFFQAEDGIRDYKVTEFRRVLFRSVVMPPAQRRSRRHHVVDGWNVSRFVGRRWRSEEHTSELQSPCNLVCRLLLEKKKKLKPNNSFSYTGDTMPSLAHTRHTLHMYL